MVAVGAGDVLEKEITAVFPAWGVGRSGFLGVFLEVEDSTVAADVGLIVHIVSGLAYSAESPAFNEVGTSFE